MGKCTVGWVVGKQGGRGEGKPLQLQKSVRLFNVHEIGESPCEEGGRREERGGREEGGRREERGRREEGGRRDGRGQEVKGYVIDNKPNGHSERNQRQHERHAQSDGEHQDIDEDKQSTTLPTEVKGIMLAFKLPRSAMLLVLLSLWIPSSSAARRYRRHKISPSNVSAIHGFASYSQQDVCRNH
eukprot:753270-Hanusia_phi.AAC.4